MEAYKRSQQHYHVFAADVCGPHSEMTVHGFSAALWVAKRMRAEFQGSCVVVTNIDCNDCDNDGLTEDERAKLEESGVY